jgi:L-ribulokinase
VDSAAAAMGGRDSTVYRPDELRAEAYDRLYAEYRTLHDYFGRGANDVMHRLRAIRNAAIGSQAVAARSTAESATSGQPSPVVVP